MNKSEHLANKGAASLYKTYRWSKGRLLQKFQRLVALIKYVKYGVMIRSNAHDIVIFVQLVPD